MKEELRKLKLKAGLFKADYEESAKWEEMKKNGEELPEDVVEDIYTGKPYRVLPSELTAEEELLLIKLKQLECLKSIRRCCIFFVVMAVIAIFLSLILIR